jgi:hypothetical protein
MLAIDTSGSMGESNEAGSSVRRLEVVGEVLQAVVNRLAEKDSQAGEADAAGEEGGVMTVTFASTATDLEDLTPSNCQEKLRSIRWGGGTHGMPAWNMLNELYAEEFLSRPATDRPLMLALFMTDGEMSDIDEFAQAINQAKGKCFVILAVLGYGHEHDQVFAKYQTIADSNDHVRLVSFGNTTSADAIADAVIRLIG